MDAIPFDGVPVDRSLFDNKRLFITQVDIPRHGQHGLGDREDYGKALEDYKCIACSTGTGRFTSKK